MNKQILEVMEGKPQSTATRSRAQQNILQHLPMGNVLGFFFSYSLTFFSLLSHFFFSSLSVQAGF